MFSYEERTSVETYKVSFYELYFCIIFDLEQMETPIIDEAFLFKDGLSWLPSLQCNKQNLPGILHIYQPRSTKIKNVYHIYQPKVKKLTFCTFST